MLKYKSVRNQTTQRLEKKTVKILEKIVRKRDDLSSNRQALDTLVEEEFARLVEGEWKKLSTK